MSAVRRVGYETSKSFEAKGRPQASFWDRFLVGTAILEIGYRGHSEGHLPITEHAIGVDLDFAGYDGVNLPFAAESQDAVYSSHCLEHIADSMYAICEWFRVLRIGGHLITVVPSAFLYERTILVPPSRWNGDHKRAYTPASLLREIEIALLPNTYRVRHCQDNDDGYDYSRQPHDHPHGCYEIEMVIQKIAPPNWKLGE